MKQAFLGVALVGVLATPAWAGCASVLWGLSYGMDYMPGRAFDDRQSCEAEKKELQENALKTNRQRYSVACLTLLILAGLSAIAEPIRQSAMYEFRSSRWT